MADSFIINYAAKRGEMESICEIWWEKRKKVERLRAWEHQ